MDMESDCKQKLARFRIKELKDVLGQLGLSKNGRKKELVDRILELLSSEEDLDTHGSGKKKIVGKEQVAKIIDDAYRKMHDTGAADLTSDEPADSEISSKKHKEVRCPCGSSMSSEFMIQCADTKCQVFQHIICVMMPEEATAGFDAPPQFYCELCRINRSDPFRVTVAQPLSSTQIIITELPPDGSTQPQRLEAEFEITRAHIRLLKNTDCEAQVWCVLLNDSVPFRMHWPKYASLKINGNPIKTASRPGSQKLGVNGRDEGSPISLYIAEGFNDLSFSASDARSFCLGVRIVRRCTIKQVMDLIPSEQDGEPFSEALARVCRCIGGGMDTTKEDSDSDLEVISDSITVNLRCPMSGSRIKTASRFKPCVHLGCFDLDTFVQLNQKSKKWQCPICLKNYSLEDMIIDPYFNLITKMMRDYEEDITEIDVKPDGSWRAKSRCQSVNLQQWHLPDGSVCVSSVDSNMEDVARQNNPTSETRIKNNVQNQASGNQLDKYFEKNDQEIIYMSSSDSESGQDDRPRSINHQHTGFDFSVKNDREMLSMMPYNFDRRILNRSSESFGNPNLIVLSDSDDEQDNLVWPRTVSLICPANDSGSSVSANPEIPCSKMDGPLHGSDLFGNEADGLNHLKHSRSLLTAPLLPSTDVEARSDQTSNAKRSGDPFSFPRQPRSRRRLQAPGE